MNWEAIGAVGEILAAVTVIATIFYLAVQVRHVQTETVSARMARRTDGRRELNILLLDHSELVVKSNAEENLSNVELFELSQIYESHEQHYFHSYNEADQMGLSNSWVSAWLFARFLKANLGFCKLFQERKTESRPGGRYAEFAAEADSFLNSDLSFDHIPTSLGGNGEK